MKIIIISLVALFITGCSSTGVVQTGKGQYMIAKTSAGGGFVSAEGTKAELYKEANAFCNKQGMVVDTIKITGKDGRVFVRSASAELQFRCIK